MITFQKLGSMGRLANSMFQIASTIGIARKNNHPYIFPKWKHSHAFKRHMNVLNLNDYNEVIKEKQFHYEEIEIDPSLQVTSFITLEGYFQSEKYWEGHEDSIKSQFEFTDKFISESISGYEYLLNTDSPVIAIHIRRGDYVNNPNYVYLKMSYYHNALKEFGDLSQYNLLVFSDDIEYCKTQFACLDNVFYAETPSALHDLCLMTQCDHFICANSTFSWWGSYLGAKEDSKVIVPDQYFFGKLSGHNTKDFWHSKCKAIFTGIVEEKVSVVTPVKIDSKDRERNINLLIRYIDTNFNLFLTIGEQGSEYIANKILLYDYFMFQHLPEFHRTKMINDMVKLSNDDIVINWDADCLVPYLQIMRAIEMIERGEADFIYPYTEWCKVPRSEIKSIHKNDPGFIKNYSIRDKGLNLGGCIVMRKSAFIEAGLENENFKGYGCEDRERYYRWNTLGYKVARLSGKLFHLEHWRGHDSDSLLCTHSGNNVKELSKVLDMDKKELKKYIKTWPWLKF